jgi:hypothetical protein
MNPHLGMLFKADEQNSTFLSEKHEAIQVP